MTSDAKTEFSSYFTATIIGTFAAVIIPGGLAALLPFMREGADVNTITGLLSAVLFVIVIWVLLKITQTALAYFTGMEFPTSTVFWYMIVAQVFITLLFGVVLNALLGIELGSGLIASLLAALLVAGAAAALFQKNKNAIPAERPLKAYWRPFYAGLKFTGLVNKPQPPKDGQQ